MKSDALDNCMTVHAHAREDGKADGTPVFPVQMFNQLVAMEPTPEPEHAAIEPPAGEAAVVAPAAIEAAEEPPALPVPAVVKKEEV